MKKVFGNLVELKIASLCLLFACNLSNVDSCCCCGCEKPSKKIVPIKQTVGVFITTPEIAVAVEHCTVQRAAQPVEARLVQRAIQPIEFVDRCLRYTRYYELDFINKVFELLWALDADLYRIGPNDKNVIIIDIDGTAIDLNGRPMLMVVDFYERWNNRGFSFIFLTARSNSMKAETDALLRKSGYNNFKDLICMPDDIRRFLEQTNAPGIVGRWKAKQRRIIASNGFRICATLDDLDECLGGGYTGFKVKIPSQVQG